ncbi:MAG: glycosyltransferase family 39 protein [Pseudomonadota bacterium]
MLANRNKINHLDLWLYLFISVHVIAWTLVPYLTRFTLPMDAMEGTIWGQHFQWGYDKNPFLNGWLTGLALDFADQFEWGVYLFSQLSVAICFWSVWELGKKILSPLHALIAVFLLEGVQYYNLHAIDFDDNTIELSLWALTALCLYNALQKQKLRDWLLTGCFAGLGMMTKYYTAMLLLSITLFLIFNSDARRSFYKPQFYAGLCAFLLVITPHLVWLFFHDFITVNYALERINSKSALLPHANYSVSFAWEQFAAFIPAFVLVVLLMLGRRPWLAKPRTSLSLFNLQFLFFIGVGPYLLTVILSALTGIKLRAGWGEPLLSLWGIILLAWLQPNITTAKFYRFMMLFFSLLAVTVTFYATTLIRAAQPSSGNFPGKIIAATLTRQWHETQHAPLYYVGGSRWLAGNVAFYSRDKPAVFIDWDKKISPWINENDLQRKGAVFVWDTAQKNEPLPEVIRQRFAKLGQLQIMHFSWLRNPNAKPIVIGVAILPPDSI